MTLNPRDYLRVVRKLDPSVATPASAAAAIPPTESELRTGVGRAYYSAFLVARSRLESVNRKWDRNVDQGVHSWVQGQLKVSGDRALRKLGNELVDLYDLRVHADYVLADGTRYVPTTARQAAEKAEIWINNFDRIPESDFKAALGIR